MVIPVTAMARSAASKLCTAQLQAAGRYGSQGGVCVCVCVFVCVRAGVCTHSCPEEPDQVGEARETLQERGEDNSVNHIPTTHQTHTVTTSWQRALLTQRCSCPSSRPQHLTAHRWDQSEAGQVESAATDTRDAPLAQTLPQPVV